MVGKYSSLFILSEDQRESCGSFKFDVACLQHILVELNLFEICCAIHFARGFNRVEVGNCSTGTKVQYLRT